MDVCPCVGVLVFDGRWVYDSFERVDFVESYDLVGLYGLV